MILLTYKISIVKFSLHGVISYFVLVQAVQTKVSSIYRMLQKCIAFHFVLKYAHTKKANILHKWLFFIPRMWRPEAFLVSFYYFPNGPPGARFQSPIEWLYTTDFKFMGPNGVPDQYFLEKLSFCSFYMKSFQKPIYSLVFFIK